MYKQTRPTKTSIRVNTSKEGEMLEIKVRRIVTNKEPIKDGAPLVYQERKDGINPDYNIRTDRWEVAAEASTKIDGMHKAKREGKAGKVVKMGGQEGTTGNETGGQSIQGTDSSTK